MRYRKSGFTLIELSIVLVVIGLIVGGVLAGQAMIDNARLRAVSADFGAFKQAISVFNEKYKSYPGDMPNATQIWGTDPDGCLAATVSETVKRTTCNGNGDGMLGDIATTPVNITSPLEVSRAWQQLSNADLIKGAFTGAGSNNGVTWWKPGTNIPAGRINSANGFTLSYSARVTATANAYLGNYQHVLVYGAATQLNSTSTASSAGLTGVEAKNIDDKIDDGRPGQGNLRSFAPAFSASCASSAVAESAIYITSGSTAVCSLIFITGY